MAAGIDVSGWTDIVQVAAGQEYTGGLKTDGTMVGVGNNGSGQCNVGGWTDIQQVSAGPSSGLDSRHNRTNSSWRICICAVILWSAWRVSDALAVLCGDTEVREPEAGASGI